MSTEHTLRAAGWFPGRQVDTARWEDVLREHGGFEIHDAARAFLREFGGLLVERAPAMRALGRTPFHLDPLAAEWEDEIFEVLSEQAGASLYPVGSTDRGGVYLGMAPDGAMYSGLDDVALVARTPDAALERLTEVMPARGNSDDS
ncbi:SUKH-3 domain-containing protein [Streptomyces sp. NPDC049879]|uniref:SUKH-3 domain-containing protein n=1 Tax=Streptomyces sp. NPDC049879 TaxID=3365598 RepID=UPI003796BCEB